MSYSAEAGASYTNPDTTGILRLFGMEGNTIPVDLSEDNAYPASQPSDLGSLTQGNRGELFYQDFRLYGALGASTLQPINWPDVPGPLPYQTGSRMGPYNVAGSADSNGLANLNPMSLVMDYSLLAGQWVGTQLTISSGDVDLSGARSITIRLRGVGVSSTAQIHVEVGSISEDLDGQANGVPKAEPSSASAGFQFVQANGPTLLVGAGPKLQGNGRLDTEDRNGNGLLDLEDSYRIVSNQFTQPVTSAWSTQTFELSDVDRQKLLQARGVRIIVTDPLGSTGKIIIDSLTVEGTPFSTVMTGSDARSNVSVQEVSEILALGPVPSQDLPSAFPATYKLFHPNSEPNQVLETVWNTSGSAYTGPFTVQGFAPIVPGPVQNQGTGGIQYQTIVSYIRSSTPGATYQFSLMDNSSPPRGIAWTVTVSDNVWHEVKVSRKDNTLRIDGAVPPSTGSLSGSLTQFDSGYGSLGLLKVTVSGVPPGSTPPPGGFLFIDEVYCTDPQADFGAALVGTFDGKFAGTNVKVGNVAVVSNLAVHQELSLVGAGFAPLYGTPSPTEDLSSRTHADADVLFTHTSVDVEMREAGGVFTAAGGHKVVIPSLGIPVSVSDAFSLDTSGGFSRENTLGFTPGSFLSLQLDTTANASTDETANSGLLTQGWQANLTVNPFSPLSVTGALSLSQALSGYPIAHDWYGARWINESALVIPWSGGGEVLRTEKLDFRAGIPASPVGFSLEAETDTSKQPDVTATGFSQQNNVALSAGVQTILGQGSVSNLSMSLVYKRQLSLTTAPTGTTTAGPVGRIRGSDQ